MEKEDKIEEPSVVIPAHRYGGKRSCGIEVYTLQLWKKNLGALGWQGGYWDVSGKAYYSEVLGNNFVASGKTPEQVLGKLLALIFQENKEERKEQPS